ncbi:phage conserved hypothetical protein, phiE125 gp8 family [Kaistia soli DSM 19436]|uniref:Phage gp6-like head-tail connector protein n=1 Tax=Kaistia soli DSM 19436 TaxID=1122133 RepID=A0A1M4YHS8_9HYPH|nr:head-tail connector protein [Kaistia soli]SHF05208.1 phage conserved hypothetical protein, phiE125 gp8 family [Kaistia soli DSM 19436]
MLKRLGPSQGAVISLEDLKSHLRIDTGDDDNLLKTYLAAATATAEAATGRVFLPTAFEFSADGFGCALAIPAVPLRGDVVLAYLDPANQEQTVDTAEFYAVEDTAGFSVITTDTFTWPDLSPRARPVRVRFRAGYDSADPASDPAIMPLDPRDRQMVIMLVGHWYEHRETVGEASVASAPLAFDLLASQRRIYR